MEWSGYGRNSVGRSKVVLRNQNSWPIARKELVAAVTTVELSKQALNALELPGCKLYFWCDSRNVLQWIQNRDLRLDKFISCRITKIVLYSELESWRYCHPSVNPEDVASRRDGVKKSESRKLWFNGLEFLRQSDKIRVVESSAVSVKRVTCVKNKNELRFPEESLLKSLSPFKICRMLLITVVGVNQVTQSVVKGENTQYTHVRFCPHKNVYA